MAFSKRTVTNSIAFTIYIQICISSVQQLVERHNTEHDCMTVIYRGEEISLRSRKTFCCLHTCDSLLSWVYEGQKFLIISKGNFKYWICSGVFRSNSCVRVKLWQKVVSDNTPYIFDINIATDVEQLVPVSLGFLSSLWSGLGISSPLFFDTRTFVPSSKYLLFIFVGKLSIFSQKEKLRIFSVAKYKKTRFGCHTFPILTQWWGRWAPHWSSAAKLAWWQFYQARLLLWISQFSFAEAEMMQVISNE